MIIMKNLKKAFTIALLSIFMGFSFPQKSEAGIRKLLNLAWDFTKTESKAIKAKLTADLVRTETAKKLVVVPIGVGGFVAGRYCSGDKCAVTIVAPEGSEVEEVRPGVWEVRSKSQPTSAPSDGQSSH